MHTYKLKELLNNNTLVGQEIHVKGWVRSFRSNRFIQLNDGSTIHSLQAVVDFEQFDESIFWFGTLFNTTCQF
jgi:asparaginyl-tRNA synthetase